MKKILMVLGTDVYENARYGYFAENHYNYWKPKPTSGDEVISCELAEEKCKAGDEFNNLVRPNATAPVHEDSSIANSL